MLATRRWLSRRDTAHVVRAREGRGGRVCVARFEFECEIARRLVMKLRCIRRHRIFERADGGEIAVVDFDELARVLGNVSRISNDHCDRLADITHAPERKHRVMHLAQLLPALTGVVQGVGQRFETGFAHIFARDDSLYAGVSERATSIETEYLRMRTVGTQERGVELPGQIPVGAVASIAGHEAQVLAAAHRDRVLHGVHANPSGRLRFVGISST